MEFDHVTYQGPAIDDHAVLEALPEELPSILQQVNGVIAGAGAFHLRGACREPAWHSLAAALHGPTNFAARYRSVREGDIPFAQDALGDQYLWREGAIVRLDTESDEIKDVAPSLVEFLEAVSASPVEYLQLGPLVAFWEDGGTLAPGQLLSVYPPLVMRPDSAGYSYRAVNAADRLGALAGLAAQIRDLPDGTPIQIEPHQAAG